MKMNTSRIRIGVAASLPPALTSWPSSGATATAEQPCRRITSSDRERRGQFKTLITSAAGRPCRGPHLGVRQADRLRTD